MKTLKLLLFLILLLTFTGCNGLFNILETSGRLLVHNESQYHQNVFSGTNSGGAYLGNVAPNDTLSFVIDLNGFDSSIGKYFAEARDCNQLPKDCDKLYEIEVFRGTVSQMLID